MLALLMCLGEYFEQLLPNSDWLSLMANHSPALES
jgi:hypothetical protein